MTFNESGSNGSADRQRQMRSKLREATVVLPNGRHVRRNVTFGRASLPDTPGDDTDGEQEPLLGSRSSQQNRGSSLIQRFVRKAQARGIEAWKFANSNLGRGIFKCSLAYLLGSMATFIPAISNSLGQQDGKHMVATITVYFHPARSVGSMFEAMLCAAVAFIYAAVISFSSMGVSIFFGKTLDLIVLGHAIVLIVFCGAGLGLVGWVKQRMSHPLVNISCSLTALALITILTKEGAVQAAEFSDDKVTQVMLMILMGVAATTIVSITVFPVSARKSLQYDLVTITDTFADQLTMITRAFLNGSEGALQQQAYTDSMDKCKKSLSSMVKNLAEAKYEHYILGTEKEYHLHTNIVTILQRLAQNTGGLRSAATTQFILLAEPEFSGTHPYHSNKRLEKRVSSGFSFDGTRSPTSPMMLSSIEETPEVGSPAGGTSENMDDYRDRYMDDDVRSLPPVRSASDIFARFIVQLGPSMKSLAVTMKDILDELRFDEKGRFEVNSHFLFSLDEALRLFSRSRKDALELLYKNKELTESGHFAMEADFEEVAASCGYFSFSLQDFANEMKEYLEALDQLKLEVEERPSGRTWSWLKIWRYLPEHDRLVPIHGEDDLPGDVPSPAERKTAFAHEEINTSKIQVYRRRLWRTLGFFRRDDIKFAIKVGVGAALYALPAYLSSTRPFYQHWRGEWGLLSYMLVCAMTLGASNNTGLQRFFGTVLGAVLAIISWEVSNGNVFLLAFFGWVMSLWTAYIIIAQGRGPMGRFIMLTYNLSALYAYSLSVKDVDGEGDDEGGLDPVITEITLHRTAAVLSGCLWGLIITRLIWPISARQKFKDGLSILWLRMGLIWKRDPLDRLIEGASPHAYMDLNEEFDLHQFLTRLDKLRASANSEFDIRGPFQDAAYAKILKSTGAMLDAFHAMNVRISKDMETTPGEAAILEFTASERASLCARISHLFQVLASSMKLEFPMNGPLPSVDHTRDRLLAKMFHFRQEKGKDGANDEDFELLYAYVLVTGQLSKEIKDMGKEVEKLFGVLNEDLLKLQ